MRMHACTGGAGRMIQASHIDMHNTLLVPDGAEIDTVHTLLSSSPKVVRPLPPSPPLHRRRMTATILSALLLLVVAAPALVSGQPGGGGGGGGHHGHHGHDDPNTESRWECHDGKDNDGDGIKDCDDPDCAAHPCCTGLCKNPQFDGHHHFGGGKPPFCSNPMCKPSTLPCPYQSTAALTTALKTAGCEITNQNYACSMRCAQTYLPATRSCATLLATLPTGPITSFRNTCLRQMHTQSHDRWHHHHGEHRRGCHDGKDNDGDGKADCADSSCASHPCCQGPTGPAAQCSDPQFAAARPWCTDPNCVATSKPPPVATSCDTSVVLPVLLQCGDWMQIALADDGKIDRSDGFCDSTCYEFLAPVYNLCHGKMATALEAQLSKLTSHLGTCSAQSDIKQKHRECAPVRLQTACRDSPTNVCSTACLRAVEAMRTPCHGNAAFQPYEQKITKCAENIAQRQCKGLAFQATFLQYINNVCCATTTGSCASVPTTCSPECANVFMP
jgi:hypothetical protein